MRKLFSQTTDQYNKPGFYVMKFYKNGEPINVFIDDFLPMAQDPDSDSWAPIFSRTKIDTTSKRPDELWVSFLEKAWAKTHGSYARIEAGNPGECLRDLTGAPYQLISPEEDNFWEELMRAEENKWLVVAGTSGSSENEEALNAIGLVGMHA